MRVELLWNLTLHSRNNLVGTIPNELALLSDSLGKFVFGLDYCVIERSLLTTFAVFSFSYSLIHSCL